MYCTSPLQIWFCRRREVLGYVGEMLREAFSFSTICPFLPLSFFQVNPEANEKHNEKNKTQQHKNLLPYLHGLIGKCLQNFQSLLGKQSNKIQDTAVYETAEDNKVEQREIVHNLKLPGSLPGETRFGTFWSNDFCWTPAFPQPRTRQREKTQKKV